MDIFHSVLTLYVSMLGRTCSSLCSGYDTPTGSPCHMETHLTPLSFQLLTRQSLYINALLTLPGPGHLVPDLAFVGIPGPSHSGFSPCSATVAYHYPMHTHTPLRAQVQLMTFAQIVRERERMGKRRRQRDHN